MQQKNQLLKFVNGRTYSIISLTQLTPQMVINIKENQIPHFVFQKVKYSQKILKAGIHLQCFLLL